MSTQRFLPVFAFASRAVKGVILSAIFSGILAGCITLPEMKNRWSFVCPDGYRFEAVYNRKKTSVVISYDDQSAKLRLQDGIDSDTQPRYANDDIEFMPLGVLADLVLGPDAQSDDSSTAGEPVTRLQCQGSAY